MRAQRGDTIIEVMLAFVVFSLVVVSTLSLMNKGMATAQRSLELTLVRQQIDSQITMLDRLRQASVADWRALTSTAADAQPPALASITTCPGPTDSLVAGSFYLAATADKSAVRSYAVGPTTFEPARTFASVDTFAETAIPPAVQPKSYGIWVTLVKSEGFATNRAYDIHVRACWSAAGDTRPSLIATVTRVYDAD